MQADLASLSISNKAAAKETRQCRLCGTALEPFMSFGRMPLANRFLEQHEFSNEYFFELKPAFCPGCGCVQLVEQPNPSQMFHHDYPFFTGSSKGMTQHFHIWANSLIKTHLRNVRDPFVVEIGSNDGTFLECFAQKEIRCLGVDPASLAAARAKEKGIETRATFFDETTAEEIVQVHGRADLIVGANVLCHIADIKSVAEGIRKLLKPGGHVVFEDPYLGDMLAKTAYDQIYDEHVFLFSAASVRKFFHGFGFQLVDAELVPTHGGSLRSTLTPELTASVSPRTQKLLEKESAFFLPQTYDSFRGRCESSRDQLVTTLKDLHRMGKRVMGYAATSKSTTILNYCGVSQDLVEAICDTTPEKQGKFSPGRHIPIASHEKFAQNSPDFALLFAWNHEREIFDKEKAFTAHGGRWLTYVPNVRIL